MPIDNEPSVLETAGTKLHLLTVDTIYTLQKEIMKVFLLAAAGVIFQNAQHAARYGSRLRLSSVVRPTIGLLAIVALVSAVGSIYTAVTSSGRSDRDDSERRGPIALMRAHPLETAVAVAAIAVVDRFNVLVGAQDALVAAVRAFAGVFIPPLLKVLTLGGQVSWQIGWGSPPPPPPPRGRQAALLLAAAAGTLARLRSQRAPQQLLELQQRGVDPLGALGRWWSRALGFAIAARAQAERALAPGGSVISCPAGWGSPPCDP